jgi:hypothetical protein
VFTYYNGTKTIEKAQDTEKRMEDGEECFKTNMETRMSAKKSGREEKGKTEKRERGKEK